MPRNVIPVKAGTRDHGNRLATTSWILVQVGNDIARVLTRQLCLHHHP